MVLFSMKGSVLFIYMVFTLSLAGCQESGSLPQGSFKDALVLYTGEPDVDGCGYVVIIEDKQFKPLNLPTKFQKDSLRLKMIFEMDPSGFNCGDLPFPKPTIRLKEVIEQ